MSRKILYSKNTQFGYSKSICVKFSSEYFPGSKKNCYYDKKGNINSIYSTLDLTIPKNKKTVKLMGIAFIVFPFIISIFMFLLISSLFVKTSYIDSSIYNFIRLIPFGCYLPLLITGIVFLYFSNKNFFLE